MLDSTDLLGIYSGKDISILLVGSVKGNLLVLLARINESSVH